MVRALPCLQGHSPFPTIILSEKYACWTGVAVVQHKGHLLIRSRHFYYVFSVGGFSHSFITPASSAPPMRAKVLCLLYSEILCPASATDNALLLFLYALAGFLLRLCPPTRNTYLCHASYNTESSLWRKGFVPRNRFFGRFELPAEQKLPHSTVHRFRALLKRPVIPLQESEPPVQPYKDVSNIHLLPPLRPHPP